MHCAGIHSTYAANTTSSHCAMWGLFKVRMPTCIFAVELLSITIVWCAAFVPYRLFTVVLIVGLAAGC